MQLTELQSITYVPRYGMRREAIHTSTELLRHLSGLPVHLAAKDPAIKIVKEQQADCHYVMKRSPPRRGLIARMQRLWFLGR